MNITAILLLVCCLQLSARVSSQGITLNVKNAPLNKVFQEIKKQTGYTFVYTETMLKEAKKVSIDVKNSTLQEVLSICFAVQPFTYKIINQTVIVQHKEKVEVKINSIMALPLPPTEIHGRVLNQQGQPLQNVSILIAGTKVGTTTNGDGFFTLTAPNDKNIVLEISSVGYQTKSVNLGKQTEINIVLEVDVAELSDVVVVGYGTQKKANLTGSISVVKLSDIASANTSTGSVMKSLQGRIPGVQIFAGGDPNGWSTIRIRGTGTFGDSDPLFVIDGVPTKRNLNELSPSDIVSVQVMKDAAASSIYGSRASGGVIIITTKKAKKGTQIQFETTVTAQTYKNPVKLLNTEQRGIIQWQAYRNDGLDPNTLPYYFDDHQDDQGNWVLDRIKLPEFLDNEKTMKPANTDWADILARTGLIQSYNVSISQGTERSNTILTFNHFDNKGTIIGSRWIHSSLRLNTDYNFFNKRLTIGENFYITKLSYRGNINSGIINAARLIQPIVPVYTISGGYGGPAPGITDHALNLVRIVDLNKNNGNDAVRMFSTTSLDFKIAKGLAFHSNLGLDYVGFWERNMQVPYKEGFVNSTLSKVTNNANYSGNWVWNSTVNYKLERQKHDLDIMVGHETMAYNIDVIQGSREQFASYDPIYMYLNAGESNPQSSGWSSAYSLFSYFGRINYAFSNKYLFSTVLRRDGSSRFGKNNRYGTFPAFSAGWKIDRENFLKNKLEKVSELKLRLSWGQTGNQATDDYATYGKYAATYATDPSWLDSHSGDGGTAYDIQGAGTGRLPSGYVLTQFANPNLRWEISSQANAGIDFGFINQKITGSLDFFKKYTSGILVRPPALSVIGAVGSPYVNGATIENHGYDFIVSYADKKGDWDFNVTGNFSHYVNIIRKLPPGVEAAFAGNGKDQTLLNRQWGSLYGLVADGIFQNQAEVEAHVTQSGKGIGRIRFKDINKDGKIDNNDRTWIGSTDPDLLAGLNIQLKWKSFDFSMFWRGVFGNDVTNWTKRFTDFYAVDDPFENKGLRTLNAWTPQNSKSTIPALSTRNDNGEDRFSTYYVEKGYFIRFNNAELGYSLPSKILSKINAAYGRVFIMGQNLLWFKDKSYSASDPEFPNSAYPQPTSYSIGLNVTF